MTLKEWIAKIRALDMDTALQTISLAVAAEVVRPMKRYPTPRPQQRYARTGRYGNGFRTTPIPRGAVVSNVQRYTKWVGIEKTQATIHQGRWATEQTGLDQVERSGKLDRIVQHVITQQVDT